MNSSGELDSPLKTMLHLHKSKLIKNYLRKEKTLLIMRISIWLSLILILVKLHEKEFLNNCLKIYKKLKIL